MSNLPSLSGGDYFLNEAREDAGMGRVLDFKKGIYYLDGNAIPTGAEYTAHCNEWVKQWIKFGVGSVLDRKIYHVSRGEAAVPRDQLDARDESQWGPGLDGKPKDPWVMQYLVPFEDKSGEIIVFRTSSWGGRQAVGDLMMAYGHKLKRTGPCAAKIKLGVDTIQSKKYGPLQRPAFQVLGWDTSEHKDAQIPEPTLAQEMDDSIPF